jgi:hypothetical protein
MQKKEGHEPEIAGQGEENNIRDTLHSRDTCAHETHTKRALDRENRTNSIPEKAERERERVTYNLNRVIGVANNKLMAELFCAGAES